MKNKGYAKFWGGEIRCIMGDVQVANERIDIYELREEELKIKTNNAVMDVTLQLPKKA